MNQEMNNQEMNNQISKTCKKCLVEYTNEEVNKFHGRVCRICKNKALYILNKKKRDDEVYKEFMRDYQRVYHRERYLTIRKSTKDFKPHSDRKLPDQELQSIKVKNYRQSSEVC